MTFTEHKENHEPIKNINVCIAAVKYHYYYYFSVYLALNGNKHSPNVR